MKVQNEALKAGLSGATWDLTWKRIHHVCLLLDQPFFEERINQLSSKLPNIKSERKWFWGKYFPKTLCNYLYHKSCGGCFMTIICFLFISEENKDCMKEANTVKGSDGLTIKVKGWKHLCNVFNSVMESIFRKILFN